MMWTTVAAMTTDMMYMDSGLMAETTYYYRVTAMNAIGSGDATDDMAMATTMASNSAPMAEGSIDDQMVYVGATVMVDVSGVTSPTPTWTR